ncbi:MAG: prepilin peptidase, partial [Bdellovibrionales bacterium]|nr:prepilin peptidase [Bdellovibrionales bacterium]
MGLSIGLLWHISFLLIAVIDDLVYRKFHNWLFLAFTFIGLIYVFSFSEITWMDACGGFFVGGLLMLPLVLANAIGAGDMKFMMTFGLLLGTQP